MRKPNRILPNVGAEHYQTFQIKAPINTHFVERPCDGRGVNCRAAEFGWRTTIDLNTDLGQKQARYIKYESGRKYEVVDQRDGMVTLQFSGGQPCFAVHRVRLERPEVFAVKDGDFRGNPRGGATRVHTNSDLWLEEFAENQDRIRSVREKG